MSKDFLASFTDMLEASQLTNDGIVDVMRSIVIFVNKALSAICKNDICGSNIYYSGIIEFFRFVLTNSTGSFAGSMTYTEFQDICTNVDGITIHHARKIMNIFWAFCKVIMSPVILSGVTNDAQIDLVDFIPNIDKGIKNLCDVCVDCGMIDSDLLKHIIRDGCIAVYVPGETRMLNNPRFYGNVIKMQYIGSRNKILKERSADTTKIMGYRINEMRMVDKHIRDNYLCSSETELLKSCSGENQIRLPWDGKQILAPMADSHYFKYFSSQNLYFVSGRSGTTFELMMMMMILLPSINIHGEKDKDHTRKTMLNVMMFFLHFHILRGSHSAFEVFMAFCDIYEYLSSKSHPMAERFWILLKPFLSTRDNRLTISQTKPCTDLLAGILTDGDVISYCV